MNGPGTEVEILRIVEKLQEVIKQATGGFAFAFAFVIRDKKIFLSAPRGFIFKSVFENQEDNDIEDKFFGKNFYEAGKSFIDFFSADPNIKGLIKVEEDGFQYEITFSRDKGNWIAKVV